MNKLASAALTVAVFCAGSAVAFAAPKMATVRGTIESASGHALVVKDYNGKTQNLKIGDKTTFVSVVPSQLDDVKSGDFVGIGTIGSTTKLKALEVVIFPNSMRGTGEGHYPWSVSAAVAAADRGVHAGSNVGGPPVKGTMTNGTVTSAASINVGPPVKGTMTNGTVTGSSGVASGKQFTVSYDNGQHVNITVPSGAPVVRLVPASHTVVVPGAKTFIKARTSNGNLTTVFVAVGKNGLMPPN